MSRIPRIEIPSPSIRNIEPVDIHHTPPVVRGIQPPVIRVPYPTIDYPTIDVPTEQDFRQQMGGGKKEDKPDEEPETRDIKDDPKPEPVVEEPIQETPSTPPPAPAPVAPPPPEVERPTITLPGGIEAPLPEVAPLVTAGATAVVTTSVALGATIAINTIKQAAEPMIRRAVGESMRKKKIKVKQVKPVLHFVLDDDGRVDIFEYSQSGTKLVDSTQNIEQYIRDQVETNSLYEYDNKIIIDDVIKDKFTKEGAKRFKPLFAPAKSVAKKLGARFSL